MFTNVWKTQRRNGHSCRCCLPNFRIRGDRQLKHQPKKKQSVQTPLIGLPLAIHSRVRDMTLSITLHNFTLGATTKESLINKWRMKSLNISQNPDCYIFVKVQMFKGKKLAKRCLLHGIRPPPPTHTHTHNTTLHTGLMLTRGISAFVVGSQRRIIITHDLDI